MPVLTSSFWKTNQLCCATKLNTKAASAFRICKSSSLFKTRFVRSTRITQIQRLRLLEISIADSLKSKSLIQISELLQKRVQEKHIKLQFRFRPLIQLSLVTPSRRARQWVSKCGARAGGRR